MYTKASIKVDFDLKLNAGNQLTFSSVKCDVGSISPALNACRSNLLLYPT